MLNPELFTDKTDAPKYVPTKEEQDRIGYVKKRISAMQQNRTIVDKDWNTYQIMIDAIWTPYPDERSSSNVPIASSIIELAVAEAIKIKTEYNFIPETSKYVANSKAFEHVWNHLWRKNCRDKVTDRAEYICFGFGDVPLYVGYESYSKVQSDAIVDPNTGDITWKEHTIEKDGIVFTMGDIRQFYMDNQAILGIEDCADCAYRQRESWDKFQNLASNPLYKNIDKVSPRGYSNDWKTFITQEEAIKTGDYVERRLYWNIEKDCYIELANDVEVREHPMMNTIDGEKALPRVRRGLGEKNYSVYHRGICESLLMFNSEINALREMLMDSIRKSNSPVVAIGNGLKFNGRGFSFDSQILTFNGKLDDNSFQQLAGNPPNQAIFEYLNQLYKDISTYIGIDLQNIMGTPDLTAYQTEVKRESSQKRMNVWLRNRDNAYDRLAKLLKDQIQTWFPVKDADGIYPELEIQGGEITQTPEGQPDKYKKKKGSSFFQCTPALLREGRLSIEATTNTSAPTIGAVDREQQKNFYIDAGVIAQNYAIAKQAGFDLDTVMPIKDALRDLADKYGCPIQDTLGNQDELDAAKKAFMQQLIQMKQKVTGTEPPPPDQQPGAPAPQPSAAPGQGPATLASRAPQGAGATLTPSANMQGQQPQAPGFSGA